MPFNKLAQMTKATEIHILKYFTQEYAISFRLNLLKIPDNQAHTGPESQKILDVNQFSRTGLTTRYRFDRKASRDRANPVSLC